jgi:sugar O-acyltransferase (sialic acid O-acetyltransferase NeuD family)
MTSRLAILGAGGHGRVTADCALAIGWKEVVLFDDGGAKSTGPWEVCGTRQNLTERLAEFDGVVVSIGSNSTRARLTIELAAEGARLASLIHPRATVSPYAEVGAGSVVFAGAVVNIGARLGKAVIINTGATIDHDCVLADGVHVAPGAHLAGGVTVGAETWVGVGAAVREYMTLGSGVMVGAGAVVVRSVVDRHTVIGNPARRLEPPAC